MSTESEVPAGTEQAETAPKGRKRAAAGVAVALTGLALMLVRRRRNGNRRKQGGLRRLFRH